MNTHGKRFTIDTNGIVRAAMLLAICSLSLTVATAQELSYRTIHSGHTVGAQISLAADPAGGVVFTDSAAHMVGRMNSQGNVVYIAGSPGTPGSMDGPAVNATFNSPRGVAVDAAGNIFVADSSNNKIRKIAPDGWVSTLAGTNVCGSSDGVGASAALCYPLGVTIGPYGSILVADAGNNRIRMVSSTGEVTTLAGSSYGWADGAGTAARFAYPSGLAFDGNDSVYVSDKYNQVIRRVTLSGSATTIAGSPGNGGDLDGTGSQVRFSYPTAISMRPDGVFVVADTSNHGVKTVSPAGVVTGIAGFRGAVSAEGVGLYAGFNYPEGIAAAGVEDVFVSDRSGITMQGTHAIADRATIDSASGFQNEIRQLDAAPSSATRWEWSVVIRPGGSAAQLSDTAIRNPQFTPDVVGSYAFRLFAETPGVGTSISSVALNVTCVTVPPAPTITRISGASPTCPGEEIVLEASEGYDSYLWNTGETTRTITKTPAYDTYYYVYGFVEGCKSTSGSYDHKVANPINSLSIILLPSSGSDNVCSRGDGSTAGVLRATQNSSNPEPAASYEWAYRTISGGVATSIPGETDESYRIKGTNFPGAGRYYLTATAFSMCGGDPRTTGEYIVDVFDPPSVSLVASDTVVCDSTGVTLTATVQGPLSSYWIGLYRGGVYLNAAWGKSRSITIYETGSYYVKVLDSSSGCAVLSETIDIVASSKPNPNGWLIDGPSSLCPGMSTRLYVVNPNPTSTYVWTNGMAGSSIVVTEPGTYNVTETNEYGCSGLSSIARTIGTRTPPPIPTITPSADTAICEGESITLTSSLATTYLWSNGATTRSITVNQAGSYAVTAFDTYGCQSSSSLPVSVTVSPIPVATIAPDGPTTFCAGGAVVLTASTGTSYLWSNGATTPAISATQSGSYSVTITNESGCSTTSSAVAVTVNPLPLATITPSGPTTFCEGGSVTLAAPLAASYLWSNGATTPSISVTQSGNYSVTVTTASGCAATSAATPVIVNPPPVATITPDGATNFCAGGSVLLTASPGASYLWSNGATTPSITATQTANYSVAVTDSNGCSATSPTTAVTVNSIPAATITPNGATTFCEGGSVLLTASTGASYLWSNGATTQAITATQSGNYSVTVTNATGCATTSPATAVTVNPVSAATITPSGPTTFCAGQSVILTASAGASYLWSTGATTQAITVTFPGDYSVRVTNASFCSATSLVTTVAVTTAPAPTITPDGPTSFCEGGSVVLTASAGSGYLWSNGDTTRSITVTQSGDYSVMVTDEGGCRSTSSATIVSVTALPEATITPNGPTTFCHDASIVLTASSGASYLWSTGETTQSITVGESGSYAVTVTTLNGCSATSDPIAVTENAPVVATVTSPVAPAADGHIHVCGSATVELSASASGGTGEGYSFQWCGMGGDPIPGATGTTYLVTQSGYYFVKASDSTGCTVNSNVPVIQYEETPSSDFVMPANMCAGTAVLATADAGAGQYLWSITNGMLLSDPTLDSVTFLAGESGTVALTLTSTGYCSSTTTKSATINPTPVATITPDGLTTFCQGGSVVLTASPATNYFWSNGATTQSINVTQAGNYSVTVVNEYGCPQSAGPIVVTVNALPTAAVSGGGNVCAGGSATVQATLTGTAPWSITWSDGFVQSGIATSVVTRSVSPSSTTSYSMTSVADANCTGTASGSAQVTVTPLPTAVVSGGATICNGQQATVGVTLSGVGPWAITWSDGLVQSGIMTASWNRTVSPTTTTTYSVTAVSGASCAGSASGSTTITVNQQPAITTQPASKTIKKNSTTTLTVSATGVGTLSYQWYSGASGNTSTPVGTNSASYKTPRLTLTTQYWVKVTNACGSTNSATATVTVK